METYFFEHFDKFLIIGLLLSLFFKESIAAYINRILGVNEKVPDWGKRLVQYGNHDVTEHFREIKKGQDAITDLMREHNKLDERVIAILEEQMKYGVKCRKEP